MYINKDNTDRLIKCCNELRPYTYIERITFNDPDKDTSQQDYIGVGVYPTLYITNCTQEESATGSGLYYCDFYIIRDPCYETCKAYLHNQNYKTNAINFIHSNGLHTLFIVKELAFIVLKYTDLIFELKNSRLVSIYKSRKGFGDSIKKLSCNELDYKYRVLRTP